MKPETDEQTTTLRGVFSITEANCLKKAVSALGFGYQTPYRAGDKYPLAGGGFAVVDEKHVYVIIKAPNYKDFETFWDKVRKLQESAAKDNQ